MIGNDIVDFKIAALQSNWQRKGFLEKLFTENEQNHILESEFPERRLWMFWAMKEATYKAHQRQYKLPRSFNPSQFSCNLSFGDTSSVMGTVQIQNCVYHTQTLVEEEYLHCISSHFQQKKIVQNSASNSGDIKQELLMAVSKLKKLPKAKISIEKDVNFIPHVVCEGARIPCDFSISHHGSYSAFVLLLTQC